MSRTSFLFTISCLIIALATSSFGMPLATSNGRRGGKRLWKSKLKNSRSDITETNRTPSEGPRAIDKTIKGSSRASKLSRDNSNILPTTVLARGGTAATAITGQEGEPFGDDFSYFSRENVSDFLNNHEETLCALNVELSLNKNPLLQKAVSVLNGLYQKYSKYKENSFHNSFQEEDTRTFFPDIPAFMQGRDISNENGDIVDMKEMTRFEFDQECYDEIERQMREMISLLDQEQSSIVQNQVKNCTDKLTWLTNLNESSAHYSANSLVSQDYGNSTSLASSYEIGASRLSRSGSPNLSIDDTVHPAFAISKILMNTSIAVLVAAIVYNGYLHWLQVISQATNSQAASS